MFTGIIEEVGSVRESVPRGGGRFLRVACRAVVEDLAIGGSIAVNGACLSAVDIGPDGFGAQLSPETVRRSTLGELPVGTPVNLERSLRLGDRLEGHMVSGHIDGTGTVRGVRPTGEYLEITYGAPLEILRYVVEKGSVAVDGISLTVASVDADTFRVAVIPETVRRSNVGEHVAGRRVNIECDIIGKYVERLAARTEKPEGGVTFERLQAYGYIEEE